MDLLKRWVHHRLRSHLSLAILCTIVFAKDGNAIGLQRLIDGCKRANKVKDGNAIGLQRLVDGCKQAKNIKWQEFGGGLWNFKFGRFPARSKM
jgi:hypothetical protein